MLIIWGEPLGKVICKTPTRHELWGWVSQLLGQQWGGGWGRKRRRGRGGHWGEKESTKKETVQRWKTKVSAEVLYNFVTKLMIHVITVMIMGLYKARGWSLGSKVIPQSFLLCSSLAITMATPHSALPLPTAILDMFNEEGNFLLPLTCWVEELKGLYISCTIKWKQGYEKQYLCTMLKRRS